ncbi:MAG: MFS transporter, partial [Erysipelotrichales bacterium]|nr:MFS transporter [Erysipelotrichales bacterium]
HNFPMFLLERVLLAIVIAGLSGSDTALLYESIEEKESTKVFGIYNACGTLGLLLAALLFSLYIQEDLLKASLWTIYPYAIAFFLTLFLQDVKKWGDSKEIISYKDITVLFKEKKNWIVFLLAVSLFNETVHTLGTFYNQLQYERVGIDIEWFGILYTLITLCTLSSAMIGKIVRYIKEETLISYLYILVISTCILLYFTTSPILSILCIMILQVSEALFYPLTNTLLNQNITNNRATILSCYSMLMNCNGMMTNIVFGKAADIDLVVAIIVGIVFLTIGFLLYQKWQKIQRECKE